MSGRTTSSKPLYLRESAPVPTEYEAGWAPESVCTFWRGKKKSLAPAGIRTADRLAYRVPN